MRIVRLIAVLALAVLSVSFGAGSAHAQATPQVFKLAPGGKATVTFEAFCTEFGEVFPNGIKGPSGLAPDPVRAAMSYGVGKGLNANEQQALQLQYAVWQALGTTSSPKGDATAQDVLTNGKAVPASPQGATSVLDAFSANQIKVTLDSWQPIGPKVQITSSATDNFYGRGQLTIENTSQQELSLYMPVGTLFESVDPAQQTMAGYATNVQVNNPQQATSNNNAPNNLPTTSGEANYPMLTLAAVLLLALGGAFHGLRRSLGR